MKKYRLLWIVFGMLALAGCTDNAENPARRIELKNFSNTGCKSYTRAGSTNDTDKSYFELKATGDNMLYVKHVNAMFNCASDKFDVNVEADGNFITITEYDRLNPEYAMACMCAFDLGYEIGPLNEGQTYTIKIITGSAPHYSDMLPANKEVVFEIVYTPVLSRTYEDIDTLELDPQGTRLDSVDVSFTLLNPDGKETTTFAYGENIKFLVEILNRSSKNVRLTTAYPLIGGEEAFMVYTKEGEQIGRPWDVLSTPQVYPEPVYSVNPGKTLSWNSKWKGYPDIDPLNYVPFILWQEKEREDLAKGAYYSKFTVCLGSNIYVECRKDFVIE